MNHKINEKVIDKTDNNNDADNDDEDHFFERDAEYINDNEEDDNEDNCDSATLPTMNRDFIVR